MAYKFYNENPHSKSVGDCTVRAISNALNQSWDKTYIELCIQGYLMKDMPSSNDVWDLYLIGCGYKRKTIPNTCPDCYTVEDFCYDNPIGTYIVATGSHVMCIKNGNYYDSWNSGQETVIYYYERY